ncbi:Dhp1-interacting protein Din1 [Zalerion maritima]|uniref:Decapping nuclease n=1 Tax=Zalerion maritima TaxID=339359 RepID=A0AAD5RS55_9PEZI|nr:Dhp1-interacting protein Din1 [Zalerion maritima]
MTAPSSSFSSTSSAFEIFPLDQWMGDSPAVKRPKEFTHFSYDDEHAYHPDERSMRWYYPAKLGTDLSKGFEKFDKHDDGGDEHLDSLLRSIALHEEKEGKRIDAEVVTWRGMMTKIMASPFEDRDGFEMNATLYQGCIFIEENHEYKMASRLEESARPWRNPIPREKMAFWGYKFETLSTMPATWGLTSREYIEGRDEHVVSNKAQYCSIVRTGVGKPILCLGGEVDAIWDSRPMFAGEPINWVELKTSAEIRPGNDRDMQNFERKLLKYWIQSFLLGVPKIMVGFRSKRGILTGIEEIQTATIPATAQRPGSKAGWDGNVCINFAAGFMEWLQRTINDDGVWRIRRRAGEQRIEVSRVEATGHGRILSDEFINWRIKLALGPPPSDQADV